MSGIKIDPNHLSLGKLMLNRPSNISFKRACELIDKSVRLFESKREIFDKWIEDVVADTEAQQAEAYNILNRLYQSFLDQEAELSEVDNVTNAAMGSNLAEAKAIEFALGRNVQSSMYEAVDLAKDLNGNVIVSKKGELKSPGVERVLANQLGLNQTDSNVTKQESSFLTVESEEKNENVSDLNSEFFKETECTRKLVDKYGDSEMRKRFGQLAKNCFEVIESSNMNREVIQSVIDKFKDLSAELVKAKDLETETEKALLDAKFNGLLDRIINLEQREELFKWKASQLKQKLNHLKQCSGELQRSVSLRSGNMKGRVKECRQLRRDLAALCLEIRDPSEKK